MDRDPKPERAEEGIQALQFGIALGGEGSVERRRIEVCRLGNRGDPAERLGDAPECKEQLHFLAVFQDGVQILRSKRRIGAEALDGRFLMGSEGGLAHKVKSDLCV